MWLLYLLHFNWSVAVAVGCIALAGVAAETGVVMLLLPGRAWEARRGPRATVADLHAAIVEGAMGQYSQDDDGHRHHGRIAAILWGHGAGGSVMQRIAAPMVGGMLSSTVLTLVVIPAAYSVWQEAALARERRAAAAVPVARWSRRGSARRGARPYQRAGVPRTSTCTNGPCAAVARYTPMPPVTAGCACSTWSASPASHRASRTVTRPSPSRSSICPLPSAST